MKATKVYLTILATALGVSIWFVADSFLRDGTILKSQQNFVSLTKITQPSFSVDRLESRFIFEKKSINRVYPELPKPDRLEFVYAK